MTALFTSTVRYIYLWILGPGVFQGRWGGLVRLGVEDCGVPKAREWQLKLLFE